MKIKLTTSDLQARYDYLCENIPREKDVIRRLSMIQERLALKDKLRHAHLVDSWS